MSRHTENKEEILKIYGSIDLINQRIDNIETNHLKHIQKSIDRIQWVITAIGLAIGAVLIRSAKDRNLVPSAVIGKLLVAIFALFFIENFELVKTDIYIVPLMCILCVAIPFVLITIAPRFITAAEVNLFFLLETILGPIWVWLIIKEQPSLETIQGGTVIIVAIAIHSYLSLKKNTN